MFRLITMKQQVQFISVHAAEGLSVRSTPADRRPCATTAVAKWSTSMDVPNAIDVAAFL